MKKPIIQICFSLKTGLTIEDIHSRLVTLKTKLDETYSEHNYECRSCHLTKELCIEKGFSTKVPDMFEEIFDTDYICELSEEKDFATAMSHINDHRAALANKADKLVIMNSEPVNNVSLELELFTQNRVMVI